MTTASCFVHSMQSASRLNRTRLMQCASVCRSSDFSRLPGRRASAHRKGGGCCRQGPVSAMHAAIVSNKRHKPSLVHNEVFGLAFT